MATEIHFVNAQNEVQDSFESTTLLPLLAAQGIEASLFPAAGDISHTWADGPLMSTLQDVSDRLAPKGATQPGQESIKPLEELSDADKATLQTESHVDYTENDVAMVSFVAPGTQGVAPAPVEGYSDLVTLLEDLKRNRNEEHSMVVVTL